jgi:predicted anti-sigma-YlaC factor YlaD
MHSFAQRSSTCDRARAWISLRVDGELSELEGALLDAHLVRCQECAAFSVDVTAVTGVLRAAPLEQLQHPVSVSLRLRRRRLVPVRAVASVAAVVVTAVSAFAVLGSQSSQPVTAALGRVSPATNADLRVQRSGRTEQLVSTSLLSRIEHPSHPAGGAMRPSGGPVRNG